MDSMQPDKTHEALRPRRSDAVDNRKRIIRAATAVFADRGRDVDVREIARCAGVGMGTLYRHFPTKDVLLETVVHEAFQDWAQASVEAETNATSSWDALQNFMLDSVRRQAGHRALPEALAASFGKDAAMAACTRPIRPIVTSMVEGAHATGDLRADIMVDDIFALLIALGRIVECSPVSPKTNYEKYVRVVIDGLRASPELEEGSRLIS